MDCLIRGFAIRKREDLESTASQTRSKHGRFTLTATVPAPAQLCGVGTLREADISYVLYKHFRIHYVIDGPDAKEG